MFAGIIMKFSKAADYSIMIMSFLSSIDDDALITKVQISERLKLSKEFVSKILKRLHKAGLIIATCGRSGEHPLRIPPEKITLRNIVDMNDRKLCTVKYLSEYLYDCVRTHLCKPLVIQLKTIEDKINENHESVYLNQVKIVL